MTDIMRTYKVTVEEITVENKEVSGGGYTTVGQEWDAAAEQFKNVYGHPPRIKEDVKVSTKVFEQTVQNLSMIALVAAINNI